MAEQRHMIYPESLLPRAAYVHVPFCRHRCGYCNFTVVAGRPDLEQAYLQALEIELSWLEVPRPVETLFVGGGTPTELTHEGLRRLCQRLRFWFPWPETGEVSFEANPETLDPPRIEALAEAGVHRVSLGVQSFDESKLRALDRSHTPREVQTALRELKAVIPRISLDLIFAAPGETLDIWKRDLHRAVDSGVEHLSIYGLTIERGSRYWGARHRGKLEEVDESLQREMYLLAIDQLADAGFEQYEVSNFSRPGAHCRHNEVYWTGGTYWAAGPGAARYLQGRRERNHGSTMTYIRRVLAGQSPVVEVDQLDAEGRARERLVFGLRRMAGIELNRFQQETGFAVDQLVGAQLPRLLDQQLMALTGERLTLTREGLLVSDSIWPLLL